MRILVTGATGFLGSRLVRRLAVDPAHQVTALVRASSRLDRIQHLADRITVARVEGSNFEELIESRQIDLVLHCATNYGLRDVPRPDIVRANLLLPLRLLDAAVRTGRRPAFVNTDTMLDKHVSTYSLSKKQFGEWLHAYSDEIPAVNVVLEHFFGPGDDPTKFVTSVVRSLLRREPRLELTRGEQERDFVFIDDVTAAFELIAHAAATSGPGYREYQVGRGEPVRIRDFVELAARLSGNAETVLDFGARPYRPNEVMRIAADTAALRALGWRPAVSLEEGLRRMIDEETT